MQSKLYFLAKVQKRVTVAVIVIYNFIYSESFSLSEKHTNTCGSRVGDTELGILVMQLMQRVFQEMGETVNGCEPEKGSPLTEEHAIL